MAYIALFCLPGIILIFSFARGAGWKPVLVGLPVILTILASITYQLIKELRMARSDPDPGKDNNEVSEGKD